MRALFNFISARLDPVDLLGETLFALIMALGFTGAVRLGLDEPDNHALFVGILGCNLAWAIVDGVMHVLTTLFERGRRARLFRLTRQTPDDDAAIRLIAGEFDDRLAPLTTPEDRRHLYVRMLQLIRHGPSPSTRVRGGDLSAGLAVCLLIVVATVPVVLPFLFVTQPALAARVSNLVVIAMLFGLGWWWGREVGRRPWLVGVGLTLMGLVLVLTTIALGG